MIRRPPTRIELKLEDIQEYEQLKREADRRKRAAERSSGAFCASPNDSDSSAGGAHASTSMSRASRTEEIHKRIGYNPDTKP